MSIRLDGLRQSGHRVFAAVCTTDRGRGSRAAGGPSLMSIPRGSPTRIAAKQRGYYSHQVEAPVDGNDGTGHVPHGQQTHDSVRHVVNGPQALCWRIPFHRVSQLLPVVR